MSETKTPLTQDGPYTAPTSGSTWLGPARKRAFVAAAAFLVVGGVLFAATKPSHVKRDEEWVAKGLPLAFAGYRMVPAGDSAPAYCTYKMDAKTYETLNPWGIVARVFQNGDQRYDVTVIGSNSKDSFHDPAVCFSAQGWNLSNARQERLETKTYGQVPVTMVDMNREGTKTIAMYFYRLRDGYVASNTGVKRDMFVYKLRHLGKDDEGGFIRIIPTDTSDPVKLKKFAAEWVDAAAKTSGGYY